MAQGFKKAGGGRPGKLNKGNNSRKAVKAQQRKKEVKKGNPLQIPKRKFRDEALDDRLLSKEIAKASEQKVAAKLIQSGTKLIMTDLKAKGKELNREQRRDTLKKKVGRVDQKIQTLIDKAERG